MKALTDIRSYAQVREFIEDLQPVDIAEYMDEMDEALAIRLFRMMPKDIAAQTFVEMSKDAQQMIVSAIKDHEITSILDELFLDDAVDFIEEMPAIVVKRVLDNVPRQKRDQINQFLQYKKDSAGSIMTPEFIDIKKNLNVEQAFAYIRKKGVDKETIYTCYVIDRDRKLLGAITIRALLLAETDEVIEDIMDKPVIFANTDTDQEELANDFRKYGLLAMPVVDHEERLVGIVTVDDVMDVVEEETTEDFEKMAAIIPSEYPYLKTTVWGLSKNRILWLMLLMLSATVTGAIISSFENALAAFPALIAFIPMLMGTGGNAGSQSATMVIRGMALEEIEVRDLLAVFWKEIRVAVICGGMLALVNFFRIYATQGNAVLAVTVSVALYCIVILAKSTGALLPIIAKAFRIDPAVMAQPAITTILDASSLLIYFALARVILGI